MSDKPVQSESRPVKTGRWSEAALRVLRERYLTREGGQVVETPEEMCWRVAGAIAAAETRFGRSAAAQREIATAFYEMMVDGYFLPNSPTLMNAGKGNALQYSACYVLPVGDSMAEIFESIKAAAIIQQSGGGTGFAFSRLRPKNDIVHSTGGRASGPVSFLRVFNAATEAVRQGGMRRGANMGVLRIDHPDILEFIESKLDGGITNFNISVGATDAFMEALEAGGEYDLVNPRDGQVTGRLGAREVFQRIVRAAWRTGDPGMVFLDRINRSPANPVPALGAIEATNPCVTGDTWIYTSRGLARVDALAQAGESIGVALDSRFGVGDWGSACAPFVSGVKAVFRLTTREGYALRLTGDHRVMTAAGWRRADELQPGDRLHLLNQKGGFGFDGSLEEGRVLGWLVGDGDFTAEGRAVLSFSGEEKQALAPLFAGYVNDLLASEPGDHDHVDGVDIPSRDGVTIASMRLARLVAGRHGLDAQSKLGAVPPSVLAGSEALQRGFLQALFTADGHVSGTTAKGVSVRLRSISLSLLRDVQRMLLNFGIASRLHADRHGCRDGSMPDGNGGTRGYPCQPDHDLVVARDNVARFVREIGFLTSAKAATLAALTSVDTRRPSREGFTARFEALEPDGVETVYDLKEPFTNSFVANGLVVHNCGEQPLAPNDACNLGSLNLARFVREAPGGSAAVDWDELERVTRLAVRFLDDVIEVNPYPLPEIASTVKANRRIGLGVMGWADLLFLLGIPYDSEEALALGEQLMGFIQARAHDQSARLAEERGPFPTFPHSIYRDGRPLRNSTVTTIAPTGTISMIAGCSSGIEPAYALAFEHRVHGPDGERVLPFISETFERLARARGFHSDALMAEVVRRGSVQGIPGLDDSVRAVFKTAHEIDYRWHVQHQAAFQRQTDNGVSKTINFPNDATEDDVAQAYLLAWQRGCLGITVFRDGSKGSQVLHIGVGQGDEAPAGWAERVVKPRPHSLGGSTYRMETPIGTAFITVNDTPGGDPFEVFVQVGKGGSDTMAVAEALGRLVSLILRLPSPLSARRRLEEVISQLSRIGGGQPTGFGAARILSLPDALARTLGEHLGQRAAPAPVGTPVSRQIGDLCRECGQATFIYEEGCKKCVSCGFNEC
ncbi:MAG TPA: ribonucleotide reductase N-terminal alpha domain-containing protein [Methylomirabilota bacterium]|nr:ribonucleotide reductase N-terminal alpha domain-containing protein [Methylomirabilota bacterium]